MLAKQNDKIMFFGQMEAMLSEDELHAEERMRESISSVGSVLLESAWADETEEEEEDEKVEAEEQIQRVTEQIASGDRGSDRIETIEEIMQLERVTAAAMTLDDEDEAVAALARRMRQCWISTIGYKISPHKTKFVVSEKGGSIRITETVQGGSRGSTPNK